MGNAEGVFQAGGACVFSVARFLDCLHELVGGSVVEAAVWPDFVVLLSPARYLDPRIEEVAKPVGSQALIAQLAVKALHMTVLRRATGLDVSELDLPLQSPGQSKRPVLALRGL